MTAKESTKQEVAKTAQQLPASAPGPINIGDQGFDASDLIIPRILLMQAQSDLVADGKAVQGDLINSLTGEKLGDAKTPLEIIALFSPAKTWVISVKKPGQGRPDFKAIKSTEELMQELGVKTAKEIPWESPQADGTSILRKRTLNFYVLLASEVEKGEAFPFMVSFQSTSYQAGRKIATHFMKMEMLKARPYAKSLKLSVNSIKSDKGNYFAWDVLPGQKVSLETVALSEQWLPVVKSANVRVHEAADDDGSGGGLKPDSDSDF